MAAPEPGLDNEVEADLAEHPASRGVVQPAEHHSRLVDLPPKVRIEEAFVDSRLKSACLDPGRHGAGLLLPDQSGVARIDVLSVEGEIISISCRTSAISSSLARRAP